MVKELPFKFKSLKPKLLGSNFPVLAPARDDEELFDVFDVSNFFPFKLENPIPPEKPPPEIPEAVGFKEYVDGEERKLLEEGEEKLIFEGLFEGELCITIFFLTFLLIFNLDDDESQLSILGIFSGDVFE